MQDSFGGLHIFANLQVHKSSAFLSCAPSNGFIFVRIIYDLSQQRRMFRGGCFGFDCFMKQVIIKKSTMPLLILHVQVLSHPHPNLILGL